MSVSNLSKALRTLGLAAALMSPVLAQDAFAARVVWTVDGPQTAPEAPIGATGTPAQDRTNSPALNFLEESGATGGNGQHS
jgi:hypothetical protein